MYARIAITAFFAVLLALLPEPVRAEGIELAQMATRRADDGLELSFTTRFELSRAAEDALHKGVPLYFVAEASVLRNRWYWRDARVARAERVWRIEWKSLLRQYRVSTGGLHQSFATLEEALTAVRGQSAWRIAEPKDIEDSGGYYLEFSYKLDVTQLPRPMQIGLQSGFALSIEQKRNFAPDFTLK
ncbi:MULTISPECIES: DUF4390 domain-containing protein [unclassified Roseateles]|uniref:DUF4390 domain-containing protein n=1 Tax=unclassified Roseateles TaxID=2626991 RepID=UPI0006F8F0B6|nr:MULTISPECIES: DUF4390 domain-containing protein [unclassified Roseateles]KQW45811.1 hypothetical protein ASC81_13070 [Pelomonas sp. Root405]KRA72655.1 hypothetical protein ASD88_13070 [Pelomonas sp. Root662]